MILSLIVLAACSQELSHGLTEQQANEILVVLDRNGIHADKVREEGEVPAFLISVSRRDAAQAWQILRDNDLPKPAQKGFDEVFSKTSLIPTATEEKALYLQAMMGELSRTVESINGVTEARVHIVLPDSDVLKQELQGPTLPKAAVLIKYKLDRNGNPPFKPDDIRRLVANSVEGLKAEDVTVVSTQVFPDHPPGLVYFVGLKVSEDSAFQFRVYLAAVALIFVILFFILIWYARRAAAAKSELNRIRASISARSKSSSGELVKAGGE